MKKFLIQNDKMPDTEIQNIKKKFDFLNEKKLLFSSNNTPKIMHATTLALNHFLIIIIIIILYLTTYKDSAFRREYIS